MIDTKIVECIIETWHRDQEHPHRGRVKRSIPAVPLLKTFIEAAFYASLKEEEGRPLAFSAVLVAENEATDPTHHHRTEILRFGSPIPFTASMIPKIAPAFAPSLSSLAVAPNDQGNQLMCWGVFSYTPTAHLYNEVPIGVEGGMYFRPDYLTISTSSPGALTFSRGNSILGRLASGYFVPATPTPFATLSLGKYWMRLVEKTEAWRAHGVPYWRYACEALEILLGEAARRGHGATIVILDAAAPSPAPDLYSPRYIMNGEQRLGARIRRCVESESDKNFLGSLGYRKLAFETLQRVAQLAAVDGALVLNSNFDVLTFGATLSAPQWQGTTRIGPDGFGVSSEGQFEVARYGARHSSALNFAGACPDSIVFVISQDGPIRAFVRESESVVICWLDCSTSMFI